MKIISFAWTTEALLNEKKVVTRRVWTDRYAKTFKDADLIQAYDRSPRVGGKPIAIIRIVGDPYKEPLRAMTDEEEKAEGGLWGSADAFITAFLEGHPGMALDTELWVIRFVLLRRME